MTTMPGRAPAAPHPARGTVGAPESFSVPIFAVCAALLSAVAPLYLIEATPDPRVEAWTGAWVLASAIGLRYAWLLAEGRPRLVEMTVWLFSYVFFGLAPLAQLRQGISPETTPRTVASADLEPIVIVALGSAAVLVASLLRARWSATHRAPPPRAKPTARFDDEESGDPTTALRPVAVRLLTAASLVCTGYYLVSVGPALFTDQLTVARQAAALWPNPATLGVVSALATMPLLVSFVSLTALRRQRPETRTGVQGLLYALVALVLVVHANPVNSPRYIVGTVWLAVAASLGLFATRRRFRVVALSAVAGLVLVFPLADAFRGDAEPVRAAGPEQSLLSGDYDAFAQIQNTVLYVERRGFSEGEQALGVALFWVPRQVWPDKPRDTGIVLAEFRGYGFTNLSAPLWAELYINAGWAAVLAGGAALGWWARGRDERTVAALRRSRAPDILGCILPFYLIFLLRGSLLQAMANVLVLGAACWWVTHGPGGPAVSAPSSERGTERPS